MSWISPHNLRTKSSPASKQPSPARFMAPAPVQPPPQAGGSGFAPPPAPPATYGSPGGGYTPDMLLPDERIPEIAPPSLLSKKRLPSPQAVQQAVPQAVPQQRSVQQAVQPQHIIRHSPQKAVLSPVRTRVMEAPVRTQILRSPMVEQSVVQPQITELIAPPRPSPVRQPLIMQSPVRHSPMRVAHPRMMPGPAMPMMADPYYMGEEFPYRVEQTENVTETDFDGPSFSYGGMEEDFTMGPPTHYQGYNQGYIPTYQDPRGYYEEQYPEPPANGNNYPEYDHGLVPDQVYGDEQPARQDPNPPPPRQDPAPPPPRQDPAPAPPAPAPPPPNQFASVPSGDPFASIPAREPIAPAPAREEVAKVKATPAAPAAVRAAPPPPAATITRAAPPPAPSFGSATVPAPDPPRPAMASQPAATLPVATLPAATLPAATLPAAAMPATATKPGQAQPYTDELHEYEEDLISRIEATLAEANKTLEEHSNRYPVRGADGPLAGQGQV